jgi:hypothetical protein
MRTGEIGEYGNCSEVGGDKALDYAANLESRLGSSLRMPLGAMKTNTEIKRSPRDVGSSLNGIRQGSSDSIGIIEEGAVKNNILDKSSFQKHQMKQ